jgi:hypothetical protein
MSRTACKSILLFALSLFTLGCPHRSPLWSPDGARIVVLAGKTGEEVDKAASQIWLVDVPGGKAQGFKAPADGLRYLAAAWIDKGSFAVVTGKWENDSVVEDSERVWVVEAEGKGISWKGLELPRPNAERVTRRPLVAAGEGKERKLVYPSGNEAVVAVSVESNKEVFRAEPAELVGLGPGGGFIIFRPEPENTGTNELVAVGGDLKILWRVKFSKLRDGIAKKLAKQPTDIVFNDTSTSHLPFKEGEPWVGVTLIFSDVGWKDGIPAYYVRLDAGSGEVLAALRGVGLSGRPASAGGLAWAVLAPDPKAGLPVRLQSIQLEDGKVRGTAPLENVGKEAVHGYAFDPSGRHFAVSLNGPVPALRIYSEGNLEKARIIELRNE